MNQTTAGVVFYWTLFSGDLSLATSRKMLRYAARVAAPQLCKVSAKEMLDISMAIAK